MERLGDKKCLSITDENVGASGLDDGGSLYSGGLHIPDRLPSC